MIFILIQIGVVEIVFNRWFLLLEIFQSSIFKVPNTRLLLVGNLSFSADLLGFLNILTLLPGGLVAVLEFLSLVSSVLESLTLLLERLTVNSKIGESLVRVPFGVYGGSFGGLII